MSGASKLGIEKVQGFAARAVLLDMPVYYGDDGWVEHGRTITADDLQGAAAREGVAIRPGDVVLIRTGYLQWWWASQPNPEGYAQAGIGRDAAEWLAGQDVVAVGCDNAAVEVIPFDGQFLELHIGLLVRRGVTFLEHLVLSPLAADGVKECLLVVAPLLVTGGTGSPINPIAIA